MFTNAAAARVVCEAHNDVKAVTLFVSHTNAVAADDIFPAFFRRESWDGDYTSKPGLHLGDGVQFIPVVLSLSLYNHPVHMRLH